MIRLVSGSWHIPAGVYPIVIKSDSGMSAATLQTPNGVVDEESKGRAINFDFPTAYDVEALVGTNMLTFDIGGHVLKFDTDAADVVRSLALCAEHDTDPFSSLK